MPIWDIENCMEWSDTMEAIRIDGLTKRYKDVIAVDDLHLSIRQGELFS